MVRGINKQIIEISCTNNEHFEKVLLIVKPDSTLLTNSELCHGADEILAQLDSFQYAEASADTKTFKKKRLCINALCVLLGICLCISLAFNFYL